jgi:putative transposase
MSRLPRIWPVGTTQHIIQRGNNRQVCFDSEQDFFAYEGWLKEFFVKCRVDIHAWVLMANHVHLLCTPQEAGDVRINARYLHWAKPS